MENEYINIEAIRSAIDSFSNSSPGVVTTEHIVARATEFAKFILAGSSPAKEGDKANG